MLLNRVKQNDKKKKDERKDCITKAEMSWDGNADRRERRMDGRMYLAVACAT